MGKGGNSALAFAAGLANGFVKSSEKKYEDKREEERLEIYKKESEANLRRLDAQQKALDLEYKEKLAYVEAFGGPELKAQLDADYAKLSYENELEKQRLDINDKKFRNEKINPAQLTQINAGTAQEVQATRESQSRQAISEDEHNFEKTLRPDKKATSGAGVRKADAEASKAEDEAPGGLSYKLGTIASLQAELNHQNEVYKSIPQYKEGENPGLTAKRDAARYKLNEINSLLENVMELPQDQRFDTILDKSRAADAKRIEKEGDGSAPWWNPRITFGGPGEPLVEITTLSPGAKAARDRKENDAKVAENRAIYQRGVDRGLRAGVTDPDQLARYGRQALNDAAHGAGVADAMGWIYGGEIGKAATGAISKVGGKFVANSPVMNRIIGLGEWGNADLVSGKIPNAFNRIFSKESGKLTLGEFEDFVASSAAREAASRGVGGAAGNMAAQTSRSGYGDYLANKVGGKGDILDPASYGSYINSKIPTPKNLPAVVDVTPVPRTIPSGPTINMSGPGQLRLTGPSAPLPDSEFIMKGGVGVEDIFGPPTRKLLTERGNWGLSYSDLEELRHWLETR